MSQNKHNCRECKSFLRCNRVDRGRNERCADYQKKMKVIAGSMIAVGFFGMVAVIVMLNNAGGSVHLSDFILELAFGAVCVAGTELSDIAWGLGADGRKVD